MQELRLLAQPLYIKPEKGLVVLFQATFPTKPSLSKRRKENLYRLQYYATRRKKKGDKSQQTQI